MPAFASIHEKSAYAEAFEFGLSEVFDGEMKLLPKTYSAWLLEKTAEAYTETTWQNSGLGVMPEKGLGEVIETDKLIKGPTKDHGMQPYALGVVIEYEAYRWDLYGIFENLMKQLAATAVDRYNLVAYRAFVEAFSTSLSKYQTFQGEPLCSTTHTRLDGGTWSNQSTTGLSYLGIQEALIDLRKTVDDRGRYIRLDPTMVIVPVELEWVADTLLNSERRPSTADNDKNTLSLRKIHSSPYITQPTYWFVHCGKSAMRNCLWMRMGDSPVMDFDHDAKTMNRLGTAYCSFEFASQDSRGLWGSTGGA